MNRASIRYALALSLACLAPVAGAEEGDKVVHLRLRGALMEAPPAMEFGALLGGEAPQNLFELLNTFKKMRSDDSVRAVIVDLDEAALDLAQIQELRAQFEKLRSADKDVWVYLEAVGPGTYLLASAASKVVMMPRGELELIGLYSSRMYFKNLLGKIGVEADVEHCGDFKSAGEPFTRTGPSEADQLQTNQLLDGVYTSLIDGIAKSRRLEPAKVRDIFDNGPYSAQEALDAGLVDALDYREDFIAGIKKRYGDDVKIAHRYGDKSSPDIDFSNPFAFFQFFGELMKGPKKSSDDAIAVIYVDGPIMSGKSEDSPFGKASGSDTIRKAIDTAADDESIKAVVLRVDSPGGSAIASEVIAEAAKRCKAKKPFVASMGGVAASGGYYVSCLADCIFAEPATITGSIGVVGMKMVTTDMWGHLGITQHEYKRGEQADLMSSMRPWTDEHRRRIQKMMNRVYDEFKGRVVEGRGNKLKEEVDALAGGRVYTGAAAKELGLVDRLGGLSDAIRHAADMANVSKYDTRILPRPKTILDMFAGELGMQDEDDIRIAAPPAWMAAPGVMQTLGALQTIDPAAAAELRNAFLHLQTSTREHVLLMGPPEIRIR